MQKTFKLSALSWWKILSFLRMSFLGIHIKRIHFHANINKIDEIPLFMVKGMIHEMKYSILNQNCGVNAWNWFEQILHFWESDQIHSHFNPDYRENTAKTRNFINIAIPIIFELKFNHFMVMIPMCVRFFLNSEAWT